jgi:hypothetical protein
LFVCFSVAATTTCWPKYTGARSLEQ